MNHGQSFQALWSRLRTEVRQLQARGYYGDGIYSRHFKSFHHLKYQSKDSGLPEQGYAISLESEGTA